MTTMMRREVRDLWADALESGEYEQTKRVLTRLGDDGQPVGYCCLGVLCELAVEAGVISEGEPTSWMDDDEETGTVLRYGAENGSEVDLPWAVAMWAGVNDPSPRLTDADGETRYAADWNDRYGATFATIAAMVRRIPAVEDGEES